MDRKAQEGLCGKEAESTGLEPFLVEPAVKVEASGDSYYNGGAVCTCAFREKRPAGQSWA